MAERKKIRTKGKLQLSKYFQKFKEGDRVAIIREISQRPSFPARLQGKTGVVIDRRKGAYFISLKDQNKEKKYLIKPIHLKKIKTIKKK